ncbi:hypothetical protein [Streptomyces sp. B29(2018)]|uniref:hypothetical protein n=1 Tax=Streptomyces sp. B29(2018) TaxID=2485016 RepID=UPI000FD6706A|nr:hypothetical protein [Streptomyces sp. B29(2018)]
MKNVPRKELTSFIKSELNRIQNQKPLASFIDGVTQAIEEKIANTELTEMAKAFPCPCCKGAGWLYTASDLFSYDVQTKQLMPINRKSGAAVRMGGHTVCPRCMGLQYDIVAATEAAEAQQAQGVAA